MKTSYRKAPVVNKRWQVTKSKNTQPESFTQPTYPAPKASGTFMCLYKNAYQYTFSNLFFIIKQVDTLSTINNPLTGTPEAAGGRDRTATPEDTPTGFRGAECFWWFAGDANGINLFSTSFHKVPFKIMSFSFLKYTFVIVNLHPVLLNKWYSV